MNKPSVIYGDNHIKIATCDTCTTFLYWNDRVYCACDGVAYYEALKEMKKAIHDY